jgi:hypothetical protein
MSHGPRDQTGSASLPSDMTVHLVNPSHLSFGVGVLPSLEPSESKKRMKESRMYAAVVKFKIETERAPAAAAAFSNDILPRVKAAAGSPVVLVGSS